MTYPVGQLAHNAGKYAVGSLPSFSPTIRDIAWAAGIYEGEGTCQSVKYAQGIAKGVAVRVVQKDAWLTARLRELFGGSNSKYSIRCGSPKNPGERREYWHWDLYGSRAIGFLETIYVFLSPRRQEQIRNVLVQIRRQEELEN